MGHSCYHKTSFGESHVLTRDLWTSLSLFPCQSHDTHRWDLEGGKAPCRRRFLTANEFLQSQGRVTPLTAGQVGESLKTVVNQEDD